MTEKEKSHRTKWLKSMVLKYGSLEEVSRIMRRNAEKSKRNRTGVGGFNIMPPEKLKEVSKKGTEARWGKPGPIKKGISGATTEEQLTNIENFRGTKTPKTLRYDEEA